MKGNSIFTIERLKQAIEERSGCTPLYLRVLKSDLHRLLSQYMRFDDIDFLVTDEDGGFNLSVNIKVKEFLEIGKS